MLWRLVPSIILSMESIIGQEALSPLQRRFAAEAQATVGPHCVGDAVCMYREIPNATIRWIVDVDGNVLDLSTFGRYH